MKRPAKFCLRIGIFLALNLVPLACTAQKPKLPRPRILEKEVPLSRDASTGELRASASGDSESGLPAAAPVIRSRVALVEVQCTVTAPDGTRVRGLTRDDFRVWEDGVEQMVNSFDAASTPASIALIIDASPSIYRELGTMRGVAQSLARSLKPEDEVAVAAFASETHLLLPFSRDRTLLQAALTSPELAQVANSSQSFIYQAVYLSAAGLFRNRPGRKAILLLTDGQDSGLGLTWNPASMLPSGGANNPLAFQDVARGIAEHGIELYVISTEPRPRTMTDAWLSAHRGESLVSDASRSAGVPLYTLYLAELTREVAGELYFLREVGDLAEIYRTIALKLEAEYTLGYYPSAGIATPGWRKLKVELRADAQVPANARLTYRNAYYVPAAAR